MEAETLNPLADDGKWQNCKFRPKYAPLNTALLQGVASYHDNPAAMTAAEEGGGGTHTHCTVLVCMKRQKGRMKGTKRRIK